MAECYFRCSHCYFYFIIPAFWCIWLKAQRLPIQLDFCDVCFVHCSLRWNSYYGYLDGLESYICLAGVVKLFTAIISLATAFSMIPLVKKALLLPSISDLEDKQRTRKTGRDFEKDIAERKKLSPI